MRRKWGRAAAAGLLAAGGAACSHIEIGPTTVAESRDFKTTAYSKSAAEPAPEVQVASLQGAGDTIGAGPPVSAAAGECYAEVVRPAVYREVAEQVLDERQPADRVVVSPPTYRLVADQVLVSEATQRTVVVPATYRTVVEEVEIEPARERVVEVPARYEIRSREMLISEGYTTWKRGVNPIAYGGAPGGVGPDGRLLETATHATGEVMCLVEVPARYETVTERVMVSPATTQLVTIPAKTRRMTRRVVDTPAQTRIVETPARYRQVTRRVIDQPAETRVIAAPPVYRTVTRQELIEPEQSYWTEVLCETNADRRTIRRIQRSLRREGFRPGPIDGIWGPRSDRAARRFQRAIGGPRGVVTLETLRTLGIDV